MTVVRKGANAAAKPFQALAVIPRRGRDEGNERQESVLAGSTTPAGPAAPPSGDEALPASHGSSSSNGDGVPAKRSDSPPATVPASSNGHGRSSLASDLIAARQGRNGDLERDDAGVIHASGEHAHKNGGANVERRFEPSVHVELSPREAHDDVMRRAPGLRNPRGRKTEKSQWELPS
jgi:hypothetical protein